MTEEQSAILISICKSRIKAVRLLAYFATPLGLFFAYALYKVAAEGAGEPLTPGLLAGYIFLSFGVLSAIYLRICLAKCRRQPDKLPQFKCDVVVGLPKLKEKYFGAAHFTSSATHVPGGPMMRTSAIGEIKGIRYNFWAVHPGVITSDPQRFTAVTRRSWFLGCNFNRFVIWVDKASPDDIKRYEEEVLDAWPSKDALVSLTDNRGGRLSSSQIKRLGFLGLFSKRVSKLEVKAFRGRVEKRRAQLYSESQIPEPMAVIFEGNVFQLSPDDLFYAIPGSVEMRYYYVVKGDRKVIVNFERA